MGCCKQHAWHGINLGNTLFTSSSLNLYYVTLSVNEDALLDNTNFNSVDDGESIYSMSNSLAVYDRRFNGSSAIGDRNSFFRLVNSTTVYREDNDNGSMVSFSYDASGSYFTLSELDDLCETVIYVASVANSTYGDAYGGFLLRRQCVHVER